MKSLEIILVSTIITLFLSILIVGCSEESRISVPAEYVAYENVIPDDKKKEVGEWIHKTVSSANPKSDEEPEDNIKQAEKTAIEIFGVPTIGIRTQSNGVWVFVPYDNCSERQKRMCDIYLGKKK